MSHPPPILKHRSAIMSDATPGTFMICRGTVETVHAAELLVDYCNTLSPSPASEIASQYEAAFSRGLSFTFVGPADIFSTQRTWKQEGTAGPFKIYKPADNSHPYIRCKTSQMVRNGRKCDIHVYFRTSSDGIDVGMLNSMINRIGASNTHRELVLSDQCQCSICDVIRNSSDDLSMAQGRPRFDEIRLALYNNFAGTRVMSGEDEDRMLEDIIGLAAANKFENLCTSLQDLYES